MALQKQVIDVPLAVGLNTRDDAKLLPPVKLLDLQNSVFSKGGALKKRLGFASLSQSTLATSPATISAAKRLTTRGDELVLLDGSNLYSYSESVDRWKGRGSVFGLDPTVTPISNSTSAQAAADLGTANGITVYAWMNNTSAPLATKNVFYAVYDAAGTELQAATSVGADTVAPRVVVMGSIVLVVFQDTTANDIKLKRIDTSSAANLATSLASSIIALGYTDISDTTTLDVCCTGTYAAFCAGTSGNVIRVGVITSAGALGVNGTGFGAVATGKTAAAGHVITLDINASTNTGLLLWEDASNVNACSLTNIVAGSGSITFGATRSIEATDATQVTCLAGTTTDTGHLWYKVSGGAVKYATYTAGVLTNTASRATPNVLATKAFWVGTTPYVHVQFVSTLQTTYFLVDTAFAPQARVLAGVAQNPNSGTHAFHLPAVSGSYEFAGVYKRRLDALFTEPSLARVSYSTSSPKLPCVTYRDVLLVGSGFLWRYDGVTATEAGFLLLPEKVTATPSNGSGTLSSSGSYSYAAYWESFDALGNREFSAAAEVFTVTMGASDDTVTMTFRPLPYTQKTGVSLALYRSALDGTVRYRVSSFDPTATTIAATGYYVANSTSAATITYEDRMPDSTLTSQELDPFNPSTSGAQQLDNIAPPAPSALHVTQDRVWAVSAENPRRVYYSKLPTAETALEFNDGLYVELEEDVTGVADVMGRPVFFSTDHVYVMDGEGPDNNGIGVYSRVEQLPADVGCYVPRTLVESPLGWVFQSRKGFRVLTPSLQVPPDWGNDVDLYITQTFTGASLVAAANTIKFLTSSGRSLCYDFERGQWSTATGNTGVSSVVWKGAYCYVTSGGVVRKEASGTYTEGGSNIAQVLETSWIKMGSIQGFGRIYYALFLLTWKSSHTATLEIAYDFEDAYSETVTITPTAAVVAGTLAYQIRHKPIRQKCNAIKFRLTEVAGTGAGLEINALALEVGIKSGANRLGDRTI